MNDERPPAPGWSMLKRFVLAGTVIVVLSAGATATVALNTVSGIAEEVFPKLNQINAPKGVVTPVYSGGPQTFMILGTDRRTGQQCRGREAGQRGQPIDGRARRRESALHQEAAQRTGREGDAPRERQRHIGRRHGDVGRRPP